MQTVVAVYLPDQAIAECIAALIRSKRTRTRHKVVFRTIVLIYDPSPQIDCFAVESAVILDRA